MPLKTQSIFSKLLLYIAGTGLAVALISGFAHYLFASSLVESSVRNQMQSAVELSQAYFERTYFIPVVSDLRLLESSPIIDELLTSFGADVYLSRPTAERLFLSMIRARPLLYSSMRLLDAKGMERVVIQGTKRLKYHTSIPQYAGEESLKGYMALLFRRLSQSDPGSILFEGPFEDTVQGLTFLAGIVKANPRSVGSGAQSSPTSD